MINAMASARAQFSFGTGWLLLCLALAVHIVDGARTGFATTYGTLVVIAPMFGSRSELVGAIFLVTILLALTPFAMRGLQWMRPIAYVLIVVAMIRGVGLLVVFGRIIRESRFVPPLPGLYSSPLLVMAAGFLLYCLARSAPTAGAPHPNNPKPGLSGTPTARKPSAERNLL